MRTRTALALALVSSGLFASVGTPPAAVAPRVLVDGAPIRAFAQDGRWIAWSSGPGCPRVRHRLARGGKTAILGWENGPPGKVDACDLETTTLAVARETALWGGFTNCCNHGYGGVELGRRGRRSRPVAQLWQEYHYYGDFLTGASGDARTLAFGVTTVALVAGDDGCETGEDTCCLMEGTPAKCVFRVSGGGIFRLTGRRFVKLSTVPPPALLSVAGTRIAVVPASRERTLRVLPHAAPGGEIQVRDARTGAVRTSVRPLGVARALALSGRTLAVLMSEGRVKRIDRFDVLNGRLLGSTRVAPATAHELDADGSYAIYRVGRNIRALDLRGGRSRLLARAKGRPIGLSIEGKRVAWAENTRGRGRIVSVSL